MAEEPSGLNEHSFNTILRKGYTARRRGKTFRVKGSRIRDRGAKGKWTSVNKGPGIGKLRTGDLVLVGYDVTAPAEARHRAVDRAIKRYGKTSTLRKLNAVRVYTRRTAPTKSRIFTSDVHYVQKK